MRTAPDGFVSVVQETGLTFEPAIREDFETMTGDDLYRAVITEFAGELWTLVERFDVRISDLPGEVGERARGLLERARELLHDFQRESRW